MEKSICIDCGNINEVKISTGYNKPENKGKKYFTCVACGKFNWVGESSNVSPKMPSPDPGDNLTHEKIDQPDWDAIAKGKVRHGVAVAFIPVVAGSPCTNETKKIMNSWVDWILQGK